MLAQGNCRINVNKQGQERFHRAFYFAGRAQGSFLIDRIGLIRSGRDFATYENWRG